MAYESVQDRISEVVASMEASFREATRTISALAQYVADLKAGIATTDARLEELWASLERLDSGHCGCDGVCLGCTKNLDDAAYGYECADNGPPSGAWGGAAMSQESSARALQGEINWLSMINDIRKDQLFKCSSMLERAAEPPAILLTAQPPAALATLTSNPVAATIGTTGTPTFGTTTDGL